MARDTSVHRRNVLKVAGTGLAFSSAGCVSIGDSGGSSGGSVHYLTFNSNDAWKSYFDTVTQEFTEETGIEVEMEYVGGFSVVDRLSTLLQSGDPPTIFSAPSGGAGGRMWSQGNTEPVTDVVEDLESMYGPMDDSIKFPPVGDEQHIVPHYRIAWGLEWFRSDVFDSNLGTTYDSYLSSFEAADSDSMRSAFIPAANYGMPGRLLNTWGVANGAGMAEWQNGEPNYLVEDSRDQWIETLSFIGNAHQYSNTNAQASFDATPPAIIDETAAWTAHAGRVGLLAARNDVDFKDDLRMSPAPAPGGDPDLSVLVNQSATGIVSSDQIGEDAVEDSKEFLRFMYGVKNNNPQRYIDFVNVDAFMYFPVFDDMLEDEQYLNSGPFSQYPVLQDYMAQFREEILPNAGAGDQFRMAEPFWGTMDGSSGLSLMVNDHLINDKSAEQAFDDNVGDLRDAFDQSVTQLEENDAI